MLAWLNKHHSELTLRFFIGVGVRVAVLFAVFNVFYLVIQPLNQPHLTLYNHLFPGRLRFAWSDQTYALVANEVLLPRLLSDHHIARAKAPDEYRVIVPGGSDMWGYLNMPQETMPVVLDTLALTTPEGKIIRSYNTAFVYADIFKDLLITQTLIERGTAPDMILLPVNPDAFNPKLPIHPLTEANPDLMLALIDRYNLSHLVPNMETRQPQTVSDFAWRQTFLAQRTDIAAWLGNQINGLAWVSLQTDYLLFDPLPITDDEAVFMAWENHRSGVLEAFAELSENYAIPVWVVAVPMNAIVPDYLDFLTARAAALNMPLLDCSRLLPYAEFTNSWLHYTAAGHHLFAEKVAGWLQTQWQVSNSALEGAPACEIVG